jgi:hypothetical protein
MKVNLDSQKLYTVLRETFFDFVQSYRIDYIYRLSYSSGVYTPTRSLGFYHKFVFIKNFQN